VGAGVESFSLCSVRSSNLTTSDKQTKTAIQGIERMLKTLSRSLVKIPSIFSILESLNPYIFDIRFDITSPLHSSIAPSLQYASMSTEALAKEDTPVLQKFMIRINS
jgi:hypothetical protein